MNYLAHAVLSFQHPDILTGNMISDFVKGSMQYQYSPGIQKGIHLHRFIDAYTDQHPAIREAKLLLKPAARGYAGPFIDIVLDHFLCKDASETPQEGWNMFANDVYVHLQTQKKLLPDGFAAILPYMIQHNWLANYQFNYAIERSFHGIARRAKYLEDASPAFHLFEKEYDALQSIYNLFFPELKVFTIAKMQEL